MPTLSKTTAEQICDAHRIIEDTTRLLAFLSKQTGSPEPIEWRYKDEANHYCILAITPRIAFNAASSHLAAAQSELVRISKQAWIELCTPETSA